MLYLSMSGFVEGENEDSRAEKIVSLTWFKIQTSKQKLPWLGKTCSPGQAAIQKSGVGPLELEDDADL